MFRTNIMVFLLFVLFTASGVFAREPRSSGHLIINSFQQDTTKDIQLLYNGKIWRNLYYNVNENQFLFSNDYLPGSITINGKTFHNILLKYDIFKDEILTPSDPGGTVQLNKEKVDSFSVRFHTKIYNFKKLREDTIRATDLYYNVLYQGKTCFCIKYYKKIEKLAVEGQYDSFYQFSKLFFVRNKEFIQISGKGDLLKAMESKRDLVKIFIKKNKLSITENEPESFIPVIRFYDSISQ